MFRVVLGTVKKRLTEASILFGAASSVRRASEREQFYGSPLLADQCLGRSSDESARGAGVDAEADRSRMPLA
jgi:hypothetical protein